MKRLVWTTGIMAAAGALLTAPTAALAEKPAPPTVLRTCPELQQAMRTDPALASTVAVTQREFADRRASRTTVLAFLDRTGALKRHPALGIETVAPLPLASAERAVAGADTRATGLCIRAAWGPGMAKWTWTTPGSSPWYWSYKPESSTTLQYASAPDDAVDAIYARSWARCDALKIPDSATITVNKDGTYSVCQNAAMAALGHVVKWVNTCSGPESGFPDDGL